MMKIPYGKHTIEKEDIDAVINVLQSDFLTQGPVVEKLEKEFAQTVGAKHALAVSSGTAGLHIGASVLGCDQRTVYTTPITFVASANGPRYCGAEVKLIDIDPNTYVMDLNKLEEDLSNSSMPVKPAGIVAVHYAGYPIDMEALKQIADKHGLWIIEDACHAPGAAFKDSTGNWSSIGSSQYSDCTVFSFHPVKHIAAGEGGMITTNNKALYEKMKLMRSHGISKAGHDEPWYQQMLELGFNYRMSDVNAALAHQQCKRLAPNIESRNAIAQRYAEAFANLPVKVPFQEAGKKHAFHLYPILTERRAELYAFLKKSHIYTQVHYVPVHHMPYYRSVKHNDLKNSDHYYEQTLSLPMYHGLKTDEQEYVIEKVSSFFS